MSGAGSSVTKFRGGTVIRTWQYDDVQLYAPGHTIHNWAKGVERELNLFIKAEAPVTGSKPGPGTQGVRLNKSLSRKTAGGVTPPGYLLANITTLPFERAGRNITFGVISEAEYSSYVINGTKGGSKIGGRGGGSRAGYFTLPPNPGFGNAMFVRRFGGQKPNDFISRGFRIVAARHPAL